MVESKRDGAGAAVEDAESPLVRWELIEPAWFALDKERRPVAAVWSIEPGRFGFKVPEAKAEGIIEGDTLDGVLKDVEGTLSDIGYKFMRE